MGTKNLNTRNKKKKKKRILRKARGIFANLIESVKSGIYMADAQGTLIFANQFLVETFGYTSKEEILGSDIASKFYANQKDRSLFLKAMNRKGYVRDYEANFVRKDGECITLSITSNFVEDEKGRRIGTEGVIRDITERKRAIKALKRLQSNLTLEKQKLEQVLNIDQRISSILDLNHLVDFVIEKSTAVLGADKCSLMLLDPESDELLIRGAKGLNENFIKKTRIKLGNQIAGLVAKNGEPLLVGDIESDLHIFRKNRPSYKRKSFLSVPIKIHGKLVGVVNVADKKARKGGVFNEVDLKTLLMIVRQAAIAIENANYYKELEYLSISDSLTDLFNHRYFIKNLDREIIRLKRYPKPLCLLMIDVDDFKPYNDKYGHLEGDIVLKEISRILKDSLRSVDIPCRYAGDEFVAILPETDALRARLVAEKIKGSVERLELKRKITISIGAASYSGNKDRHDFVMRADRALYQAKKKGRNKICSL